MNELSFSTVEASVITLNITLPYFDLCMNKQIYPVYLSVYLSVCLPFRSIYLSICLSSYVYLYLYIGIM